MSRILSVASHKGGVGKSSTTIFLAQHLANKGRRVLVIDNDAQGNTTTRLILGDDGEPVPLASTTAADLYTPDLEQLEVTHCPRGIDLIPTPKNCARLYAIQSSELDDCLVFRNNCWALIDDYDVVIIDCPPNFGVTLVAALAMSTHVISPVKLSGFAIDGIEGILGTIASVKAQYNEGLKFAGTFINMLEPGAKRQNRNALEFRRVLGELVLNNHLARRPPIDTAIDEGVPITSLTYAHVAAKEVAALMDEIEERLQ